MGHEIDAFSNRPNGISSVEMCAKQNFKYIINPNLYSKLTAWQTLSTSAIVSKHYNDIYGIQKVQQLSVYLYRQKHTEIIQYNIQ